MFTTPCFIRKNTPELRKKLEELGYRYCSTFDEKAPYLWLGEGVIYDTFNVGITIIEVGGIFRSLWYILWFKRKTIPCIGCVER